MNLWNIAIRNVFRNTRRSLVTMSAVGIGVCSLFLFACFMASMVLSFETITVQRTGHLIIHRKGYFDFGASNPVRFGIDRYDQLVQRIRQDPELEPMLSVVTVSQQLVGIAGNFTADLSKTFLGAGYIPSDRERMRQWNPYDLSFQGRGANTEGLNDKDKDRGIVGVGLAKMLGICNALRLARCPEIPEDPTRKKSGRRLPSEVGALVKEEAPNLPTEDAGYPALDLLAATALGAPNVVRLYVVKAESQGVKELDDTTVIMPLGLAQDLVYGRGEHRVSAVTLQLRRTQDIPRAQKRLQEMLKDEPFEIHTFEQLTPLYGQIVGLYRAIFTFLALIMGVIVLFSVVNTMTMNVLERTTEIGTLRALGSRRGEVRMQFLAEGAAIGVMGASTGLLLGWLIALAINASGWRWLPPLSAQPVPFHLEYLATRWQFIVPWVAVVLVTLLASVGPANRGARLPIVDALRHV